VPPANVGKTFFAYGGWFEKDRFPNDDNFCYNGLVSSDAIPHPGLLALKKEQQNVLIEAVDLGARRFRLTNRFYFQPLARYLQGRWTLLADGVAVAQGGIRLDGAVDDTLDLQPGEAKEFQVAFDNAYLRRRREYILDFRFTLVGNTPWAPAGYELAWEQFVLPTRGLEDAGPGQASTGGRGQGDEAAPLPETFTPPAPPLAVEQGDERVLVTGRDYSVAIDKATGGVASYKWRGIELLDAPSRPDFWRVHTDNDDGNRLAINSRVWRDAGRNLRVQSIDVAEQAGAPEGPARGIPTASIRVAGQLPDVNNAPYNIGYTIDATGLVTIDVSYERREAPTAQNAERGQPAGSPATAVEQDAGRGQGRGQRRGRGRRGRGQSDGVPMLPRFGTLWTLARQFDQITWYGRGPHPTYSDLRQAPLGIYSGAVADQYIPYSRPQENGNKVDVRWVAVTSTSGTGLLAKAEVITDEAGIRSGGLSVGASHFSKEQMDVAEYDFQLAPERRTYLNLDAVQMGVGGNNSWGALPLPDYLLPNRDYRYRYTIRGIDQPPVVVD
jgi:beta-galactosidase